MKNSNVVFAFIAAAITLLIFIKDENVNFEEFGLGKGTSSYFPVWNGYPIHCSKLNDLQKYYEGWEKRGKRKLLLWFGNSQLHGMNQYKIGQKNGPEFLFETINHSEYDVLAFSLPNANIQEFLVLFSIIAKNYPIDQLILPVFMDDLREDGIRSDLLPILENSQVRQILKNYKISAKILNSNLSKINQENIDTTLNLLNASHWVENKLDGYLLKKFKLWKDRLQTRYDLTIKLYQTRNFVFNIKPNTTRKMIKGRYEDNLLALEAILLMASAANIHTMLYVPPIRSDVGIPYEENEYNNFKIKLQNLAVGSMICLRNYEKSVAPEFWGLKESTTIGENLEIDYMHFKEGGHIALANEIISELKKINKKYF